MVQTGQAAEEGSTVGRVDISQVSVLQPGQGHPVTGLCGSGPTPPPSTDPSQPLFHFVSPPCWALCRLTLVVIIMGKGKSKVRSVLMLEDSIWKQLRAAPLT